MLGKFKKSFRDSQDEASEVSLIYEFIVDNDISDLYTVLEFVLENNLYSSFPRRNYVMFKGFIIFLNKKGGSYYDKNKKIGKTQYGDWASFEFITDLMIVKGIARHKLDLEEDKNLYKFMFSYKSKK